VREGVGMVMADMGMGVVAGEGGAVVVMVEGEGEEVVGLGGEGEVEVVSGVVGNDIWNGMLAWELPGIQWRSHPVSQWAISYILSSSTILVI
jgi:hypothetical protein